jgi:hypothetical protein
MPPILWEGAPMKNEIQYPEQKGPASYRKRIWLNFLNRNLLQSSSFRRGVEKYEITGIISSAPAMAECIAHNEEYRESIRQLSNLGMEPAEIYKHLLTEDAISAADILLPVFQNTEGRDGFVGIDVSPEIAYDVDAIIEEAKTLWDQACRPNIMIQIPATEESLPAFGELLRIGINVNATLLCSLSRYRSFVQAYVEVINNQMELGLPLKEIVSAVTFSLPHSPGHISSLENQGDKGDMFRDICAHTALWARELHYDTFQSQEFMDLAAKNAQMQLLLYLDEEDTSLSFGKFCCATDLTTESPKSTSDKSSINESLSPALNAISDDPNTYIEELLVMLQEEFIKTQIVRVDRALLIIEKLHSVSSR